MNDKDGFPSNMSDRELLVMIATKVSYITQELSDTRNDFKSSLLSCREESHGRIGQIESDIGKINDWKSKVNGALAIIGVGVSLITAKISRIV